MKSFKLFIAESNSNDAVNYTVAFAGCKDSDDIPVNATISISKEHAKAFEKFLKDEEGNIFSHAEGGDVEY